jgi:hypothetical protein
MIFRKNVIPVCVSLVLCAALCSCKSSHDLSGIWHGKMDVPDARNGGSTEMDAALQQTPNGLTGNITWHHPSGAWQSLSEATFVVNSGVVAADKVSIIASDDLGGGKATLNFTGTIDGNSLKGTVTFGITSIMGGGTFPGTFELKKE